MNEDSTPIKTFLNAYFEIPREERAGALAALDYLRTHQPETVQSAPQEKRKGRPKGSKNKARVNGAATDSAAETESATA